MENKILVVSTGDGIHISSLLRKMLIECPELFTEFEMMTPSNSTLGKHITYGSYDEFYGCNIDDVKNNN